MAPQLCFALAGAYAGAPLGPGPIPIEGALGRASLAAIAAAVREGCIGQTVAALAAWSARARPR
jgi:lysozyme family protein